MIPKIVHYCWFGRKPLPEFALCCINSWKKFLPDYEIKEWNEDNFDVNIIPYTKEAYSAGKYAFVSDYARFWILYHYGGIYFDTDVKLLKSLEEIISLGPFMGIEDNGDVYEGLVAPGLGMAAYPKMPFYMEIMDYYENIHYVEHGKANNENIVIRLSDMMKNHGLNGKNEKQAVAGINIYPSDYFCPIRTTDGKLRITENTVSIHYYVQSWRSPIHRFFRKVLLVIGNRHLKRLARRVWRFFNK